MTTQEMIAVMQAFVDGEKIVYRSDTMPDWQHVDEPKWNWMYHEYRVARKTYWIDPVKRIILSAWKEGAVLAKEVEE